MSDQSLPGDEALLLRAYRSLPVRQRLLVLRLVTAARLREAFDILDPLYDVARDACHACGLPWTDPRTGKTYRPPSRPRRRRGRTRSR